MFYNTSIFHLKKNELYYDTFLKCDEQISHNGIAVKKRNSLKNREDRFDAIYYFFKCLRKRRNK
jgi:hypothetical protein